MSDKYATVDAIAEDFHSRGGQPALAYGVVEDGRLVHSRGLGELWIDGPDPDELTVFRIASMTKSFTAAAVLLLRDEGALRLDDPAEAYVPELAGLGPLASPVTIRKLLTMTAGFPTDDPWGDRLQGQPLAEFADFLAAGVSLAWAPGTRFEYSNLSYAILGLVIAAASGKAYDQFVRTHHSSRWACQLLVSTRTSSTGPARAGLSGQTRRVAGTADGSQRVVRAHGRNLLVRE